MTTIAATDAKNTLAQIILETDNNEEIVIVNRGEPLARLASPRASHDVDLAVAAAERILKTAKRISRNNITLDEIKAWTNEGRP